MDEAARTFWDGCAAGQIRYQRCPACEAVQFFPRTFCAACGHREMAWAVSRGEGTVYAVTVVNRAPTPAFADLVPYALLLVDLDEGFRMMAHGAAGLAVGARVRAGFREHGGRVLPCFGAA